MPFSLINIEKNILIIVKILVYILKGVKIEYDFFREGKKGIYIFHNRPCKGTVFFLYLRPPEHGRPLNLRIWQGASQT